MVHPLETDMGCNLWFDTLDLYSALVNAVLCEISCYIGQSHVEHNLTDNKWWRVSCEVLEQSYPYCFSNCTKFCRADARFAPSQWKTVLLCNDVSHWLGASLESALFCNLLLSNSGGCILKWAFLFCNWSPERNSNRGVAPYIISSHIY